MSARKTSMQLLAVGAVLALALGLLGDKRASAKPAAGGVSQGAPYAEVDAYVEEQMTRLNVPGAAVAVVEGGKVVHALGFGQARPGGEAPTPQTPFMIGSLTKSFTAVAVMQLVEAGKIDLDAPVQRYLPWFRVADPRASAQITVRNLLNQTSSLPTNPGWEALADFDDRPDAAERQARALSTLTLSRPVGTAYEYSNLNYNLLGLVVEAVGGKTYATYVQDHIFSPLAMDHSYTAQTEAKRDGLAVGHQLWFWHPVAVPDLPVPRGSLASGQLIASVEDMAQYLIIHLNEGLYGEARILSGAGVDELHRGVANAGQMGVDIGKYAMGWFDTTVGQTRVVWHTGTEPDFASYMALLPEQNKGVVLLFNADHFMMEPVLGEVGTGLAALLAGEKPVPLQMGFVPWAMRALLLIPILQAVGAIATLRRLSGWRQDPSRRPSRARARGLHLLLPLVPNLSLVAMPLFLVASGVPRFALLFAPDFAWISFICGGFAALWTVLRTWLVLRTLRAPSALPITGVPSSAR